VLKKVFLSIFFCWIVKCGVCVAQAGGWTWMKGDSGINPLAVFGIQGIPDSANNPDGLYEASEWKDLNGNFWIYGGIITYGGASSNLWKFNPATTQWTWMKGPGNVTNEIPIYGTLGIASPANTPGARWNQASWTDTSGNLWLYGGINESALCFGDLWKYDISSNEWTWVSGSNIQDVQAIYGVQGIPNTTNQPGSRRETAAAWIDNENNLWLFGGRGYGTDTTQGDLNDLWKYNISTNEWTWMRGSTQINDAGSYGIKGIEDTTNNPPSRMIYCRWKDYQGNFWIFGGGDHPIGVFYNDVWKYNIATNKWTWMSGDNFPNGEGMQDSICATGTDLIGPARLENRACWTDECFNFWQFGGATISGHDTVFNDLWYFNYQSLEWTMVSGSVSPNQAGSYGIQGISSPANEPNSRSGSDAWVDNSGNLWLFGGWTVTTVGANDVWRYIVNPSCPVKNLCGPQINTGNTSLCEKFCINFFDQSTSYPTSWQWIFPGGDPSSSTLQNPINICYNSPGTFDVTLITTNASGSDTLTLHNYITVYPTPPFPTITQVGYTLTSSPADSYQWQLNTTDISGATNQSYNVLQSGYYTVIIGDSNSCKNSATTYVLISGIDDVSAANIFIYPNPSIGCFTVEFLNGPDLIGMADEISIAVVNTLGKRVFFSSEKVPSTDFKKQIDLSDVARGIYFVWIKAADEFVRKKILIAD